MNNLSITLMPNSSPQIKKKLSGIDMALLSLADHSIMSYGSFGMWGALLANGGETVLPKDIIKSDIGTAIKRAQLPNWTFI